MKGIFKKLTKKKVRSALRSTESTPVQLSFLPFPDSALLQVAP